MIKKQKRKRKNEMMDRIETVWPNLMAEFTERNYSSRYNSGYHMNFGPKFIFGCLYISVSMSLDVLTDGEFV